MRSNLLLPHRFQLIGWFIFIPALVVGLILFAGNQSTSWLTVTIPDWLSPFINQSFSENDRSLNLTITVSILSLIVGMGLIAFSREAVEDEMIAQLRLEAFQWSLLINYALLVVATLLVYGLNYYDVLVVNVFTPLLVFIGRFRWLLRRNSTLLAL